jgi:hypothetical protein
VSDHDTCPVCGAGAKACCKCPLADTVCQNGHHWHRCLVHDVVVVGEADHAIDTMTCRCRRLEHWTDEHGTTIVDRERLERADFS